MRVRRQRRPMAAAAAAVALGAAGLVAGCTGEDDVDLPPPIARESPVEPSPTPSPTPSLAPEEAAIVATYEGYVEVFVEAALANDGDHPQLADYLTEPELSKVRTTFDEYERNDVRHTGSMTLEWVEVVDINLADSTPYASLEACIDFVEWVLVYLEDGSPVVPELDRYRVYANLQQLGPQDWRITHTEFLLDEPC